MYTIF